MSGAGPSMRHEAGDGGGRFIIGLEGGEADLTYRLRGGVMTITHTFTPPALRGHGVASQLMRAAADHARQAALKIDPVCSYADAWMRRHTEEHDLLEGSR